jgi:hypothetical protein
MALHTFFFTAPEELARPPVGLEFKDLVHQDLFDAEAAARHEAACKRAMAGVMEQCDTRVREKVSLDGHVGCVFERSPYCHAVVRGHVCAVFAGEIAGEAAGESGPAAVSCCMHSCMPHAPPPPRFCKPNTHALPIPSPSSAWPGHDQVAEHHDAFVRGEPLPVEDDATWLVQFYDSFSGHASMDDVTEAALRALSRVQGSFAFVLYDSLTKRVWAARDAEGVQPLFWGVTDDNRLVFGTHPSKLDGCNPTATPFPAGTLYASHDPTLCHSPGFKGWVIRGEHPLPGHLLSFVPSKVQTATHHWRGVKAVPRIDAEGHICGAVYRVASERGLAQES